jgi:hypothetical protein
MLATFIGACILLLVAATVGGDGYAALAFLLIWSAIGMFTLVALRKRE